MAQALTGAVLALAVTSLVTARVRGMSIALAVQGWAVAVAVLLRGFAEASPAPWVLAAIALAAIGVAVPVAMARIAAVRVFDPDASRPLSPKE